MNYEDGAEEVVGAGEIFYWPSGHTVLVEEAVRMVEFSPHDQMSQVLAHVVGKRPPQGRGGSSSFWGWRRSGGRGFGCRFG